MSVKLCTKHHGMLCSRWLYLGRYFRPHRTSFYPALQRIVGEMLCDVCCRSAYTNFTLTTSPRPVLFWSKHPLTGLSSSANRSWQIGQDWLWTSDWSLTWQTGFISVDECSNIGAIWSWGNPIALGVVVFSNRHYCRLTFTWERRREEFYYFIDMAKTCCSLLRSV